jgi:diguanylate cyclase (GGDEF)-like protein/PAS domain S-box-containing protein
MDDQAGMATVGRTTSTRLRTLVDLSRAVRAAMIDERRLADQLARAIAGQVGDSAIVWIQQAKGGEPDCLGAVHRDPRVEELLRGSCLTGGGAADELVAAVLESGLPAVLDRTELASHADGVHPALPWLSARGGAGAAVLPMVTAVGGVLGVLLALRDPDSAEYSPDDLDYLTALADTAACALDNARLLTDSAMAAEGLRRQSEWLDQVSDAIITCDVDNQVMTWNSGAEITYRYSSAEALGCDAEALLATRYRAHNGQPVSAEAVFAALATAGRWSGELRQRRADGEEVELQSSLTELLDEDRRRVGWVAVNRDVTDERRKGRMALYDPLTGLPNRRYLLEHLTEAQRRSAEKADRLAVLFLDLDGFKEVNDTFGHEAGDEVLRITAKRLQSVLRRGDVVARLGGDEFVVVAEGAGDFPDAVRALAARLINALDEPIPVDGASVIVRGSIGVAVAEGAGTDPVELLRTADAAMYTAKRNRSGLVFADES